MKKSALIFVSFLLSACAWDPNGLKAQQKWLDQQKVEKLAYEEQAKMERASAAKEQEDRRKKFDAEHPEVMLEKEKALAENSSNNILRNSLSSFDFMTRHPENMTLNNTYVRVGRATLTAKMIHNAVDAYLDDCKRISAYNDVDYENSCKVTLAKGIKNFTDVLKDRSIPELTKHAALGDASYGNYINFEVAANLAKMHTRLCEKQGNDGYVTLLTTSAPCKNYKGAGIN